VPPTASTTGRADYWDGYRADGCPKSHGPIISLLDPGSGKANSLLSDKDSLLRSLGNFSQKAQRSEEFLHHQSARIAPKILKIPVFTLLSRETRARASGIPVERLAGDAFKPERIPAAKSPSASRKSDKDPE